MEFDPLATGQEISWCPGCGNYSIRKALQQALSELSLAPHEVVLVTGIGQGAKMPHYLRVNGFNGLHGRALPVAFGLRAVNRDLTIIAESGDGDTYGEGGNHFIHTIRRNPNIAHLVHNNQVYGLTKGQASPTSELGMKTSVQKSGVVNEPLNPLALALACGASFVARGFAGDIEELTRLIMEAVKHPGYAFLDILQPCVSYNKVNTFSWYQDRVYSLEAEHDFTDYGKAMEKAWEWGDRIPTGIFFSRQKKTFEEDLPYFKREDLFDPRERVQNWTELLAGLK